MLHSHFALHFILFCQAPLGRHLGVRPSQWLSQWGNFSGIGVFHMKPLKKIGNGDINGDMSQWKPWKPLDFWEYHSHTELGVIPLDDKAVLVRWIPTQRSMTLMSYHFISFQTKQTTNSPNQFHRFHVRIGFHHFCLPILCPFLSCNS